MLDRAIAKDDLSVRLSVYLSVTLVSHAYTVKTLQYFSLYTIQPCF